MAQDSRARSNQPVQQQQRRQRSTAAAHEQEEEVYEESVSLPYRTAYDMAEKLATTRIGQFIIARSDRLLKVIENTAKWSLPQDQMDDRLQRPLPWIPFLMIIIALRLARIWISVGALIIGNAPVKAQDVVYFVQTRRRKLRALRLRGIKEICRRETEIQARKPGYGQNAFIAQLKRFFSSAICRPGQHREPERRIMILRGKEMICSDTDASEQQVAKRPRADDCEADMTVDEMLNKYANDNDNTEDDSDFVPNPTEEDDDSATSSETSESTDDDTTHKEVTTAESKSEKRGHRYSKDADTSVEIKENGNGEPINVPKPIVEVKQEVSSDTETSETAKTPHENGPSNGAENRELDVAFKFVLTPPTVENGNKKHFKPAVDVDSSYKSTMATGHSSAPETNQHGSASLKTPTIAAPEIIPTIDLTSTDTSSDAVDSTSTETETDSDITFNISNPDSSPTLSAASSSTSLDSFIKNEEIFNKSSAYATATSTQNTEAGAIHDLESLTVASVSSSEDDFYSPIGSPPDFNAYQQNQMSFKFSNIPNTHNQSKNNMPQKTVSEPHIGDSSTTDPFYQGNPLNRRNQHQTHHGNGQHGRYRGRHNRR